MSLLEEMYRQRRMPRPNRPEPAAHMGGSTALSDKQAAIFRFIYETARDLGFQPSIREIGAKFDIRSPNGVVCHLSVLARKGWIEEVDGKPQARAIRFLRRPDGAIFAGFADKEDGCPAE